jgi:hypothetical protein
LLAHPGATVLALFNSMMKPTFESEITVSNYDGVDVAPEDDIPDNEGIIDDTRSVYDYTIDTVATTLQAMTEDVNLPLGFHLQFYIDWWDPALPGYAEPVDATCLMHHCPGTLDWATDPLCSPCNDSVHVLLNHLQTPFFYNQAQRDVVISKGGIYCEDGGGLYQSCDFPGNDSELINAGVNLIDTHWRKIVRKTAADLVRDGALLRCEGGVGNEAPYDQIAVVSPDWSNHGPLSEWDVATRSLDGTSLVGHARDFVAGLMQTPYLCLEDDGFENASDFTGVASCLGQEPETPLPSSSIAAKAVLVLLLTFTVLRSGRNIQL